MNTQFYRKILDSYLKNILNTHEVPFYLMICQATEVGSLERLDQIDIASSLRAEISHVRIPALRKTQGPNLYLNWNAINFAVDKFLFLFLFEPLSVLFWVLLLFLKVRSRCLPVTSKQDNSFLLSKNIIRKLQMQTSKNGTKMQGEQKIKEKVVGLSISIWRSISCQLGTSVFVWEFPFLWTQRTKN